MTHPVIYGVSTAIGGGALVLSLMQTSNRTVEIGAYGDPMIIAAAAVLIIGALAAAAVQIIKAFGAMKAEVLGKVAEVSVQATEIHDKVNGASELAARELLATKQQITTANAAIIALTEKWALAEGQLAGLMSPVPGASTEAMVARLQALIKEHDTWEREREAQLLAAHDVGVAAGTAAGIEQERMRKDER